MKKVAGIICIICICVFVFGVYKVFVEQQLKTKRYINEIVQLEVDSCQVYKSDTHSMYDLFIEDKYIISIDSIRYIPFKRKERVDFHVKDINSEYVVTNWKHTHWKHDMDKIMEYTKVNIKKHQ